MNKFIRGLLVLLKAAAVLVAGYAGFIALLVLSQEGGVPSSYDRFDTVFVYFGLLCIGLGFVYLCWFIGHLKLKTKGS